MAKRKVLKITPVLNLLNILVLLVIVLFYSFRLLKYYRLEHKKTSNNDVILVDKLIQNQSYVDLTKGLVFNEKDNTYIYKGKIDNNYLLYSGMLFRIVGIDSENNIRAISEDNITLLYSGLENGYNDSYINKWLNKSDEQYSGIYESELKNSEEYIDYSYMCADSVVDLADVTCKEYNMDNKITLLSLYDYKEAGGKSSYLNNSQSFYLSTLDKDNSNYYVTQDGEIGLNQINTKTYGVRPVITIKSSVKLISGNGKKDNPYIIETHKVEKLSDAYVNSYVELNDKIYKIISVQKDKVKVASTEVIKEESENLEKKFSTKNNDFSLKSGNVGNYLNETYYNDLKNIDIVKSDWYIGKISQENPDYTLMYKDKVNASIGILGIGDFYLQDIPNVFTLTKGFENNIINVINEDGNLYGDVISSQYNIRPSFYLNASSIIKSGDGTQSSPYKLGV